MRPCEDGTTTLHTAAREGDAELVRLLIERGATVDTKTREGLTPLHKAIMYNQTPVVQLLLDKGANVETRENHGKSPSTRPRGMRWLNDSDSPPSLSPQGKVKPQSTDYPFLDIPS